MFPVEFLIPTNTFVLQTFLYLFLQQRIVIDQLGFVIGYMFELMLAVSIAESPNIFLGGFQIGIGSYPAVFVCFDARPFGMKKIRVGLASGGHEDFVGCNLGLRPMIVTSEPMAEKKCPYSAAM